MPSGNRYQDPAGGARRSPLAILGFAVAVLAGLSAVAAGPGYRWGVWGLGPAFSILKWAAYGGLVAAAVSLAGIVATRLGTRRRGIGFAILGLVLGLVTAWVPWSWKRTAAGVPAIHDITTDTEHPPEFVDVLPLRADAPNPAAYAGDSIGRMQRTAYPDVKPLMLDVPTRAAFDRALEAARNMGWRIVAARPDQGRIEATDTTFWFGFKDDIVVRISPAADGGSLVDVRSVSRVGRSDVGTNAKRIREYLAEVRSMTG